MSWLTLQTVAQISVERILNAFPEGFLIALFAWALLRVLRKQNSGTRFAVWFAALLAIAALPVLSAFGGVRLPILAGMSLGTISGTAWGSMRSAITIPARWGVFVFFAWAFGASVAMVRLAAGLWRLRQLRQSCTPVVAADLDPAVRKTVEAIAASESTSITIATSDRVRVPAAIGFGKRTIILPTWALRELPAEDLNVILLHEFAHLRRGDDWTNLIQKIVRALFFFHPAVWWIENRLSVEREMACDDAVLAETANPRGYAACLVSLLEKSLAHRLSNQRWSMVHAAVNRAHEASLRLAQILDRNRPVATQVWKPALGIIGTFSVVCLLALPHAPQFVAFDRSADRGVDRGANRSVTAGASDPAYSSEAVSQSSLQAAAVIPAALHIGESPVARTASAVRANVQARAVTRPQFDSEDSAAARLNAAPMPDWLLEASASADQGIVPQFRTLVFIEATQSMSNNSPDDSPVWSVQVWRVTFVSATRERMVRVPVPHSI
jgi:beta-lactamase regulating signal transducer with metallopeptidase domain